MRGIPSRLEGQRFGSLVVECAIRGTESGTLWDCRCDCGGRRQIITTALKSIVNPGCKDCEYERRGVVHRTHGQGGYGYHGKNKTKLYMIWSGMHSRCRDPGNTSFRYYGGKGVVVAGEWATFEPFRDWAAENGYQEGLSIDRADPAGDYSPENCEWVTRSENSKRTAGKRRAPK